MKTDLIERLRAHAEGRHGLRMQITGAEKIVALLVEKNDLLREAAAALEAEASEGERRGLERAAGIARSFAKEPARKLLAKNMNGRWPVTAKPLALQALRVEKAIRALIPEAPAREGWQPISSAPKDGTNVIVAEPDGNVTIARWLDRDESWWELNNDSTDVWGFALNAVQWRPLPPPPPPSQDREG